MHPGKIASIRFEPMATAVGLILALVALSTGIMFTVDPMTCITRAGLAFLAGWVGATLWQAVFIAASRIPFTNMETGESYNDVTEPGLTEAKAG
jgi:hypothetical protein